MINASNPILAHGTCHGKPVTCFLDSGSAVSIISYRIIHDNNLTSHVHPCSLKLTSFTNNTIPTRGIINITLNLAGTHAPHPFIICDNLENDFLIGLDYMETNGLTIDTANRLIKTPHGEISYFKRPKRLPVALVKVRNSKTITLQPNTINYVSAKIDTSRVNLDKTSSYCAQYEPYHNFTSESGIFPAGSIVYSNKGTIPIQCIHVGDDPVTLYKNKLLGFLKPVEFDASVQSVQVHPCAPALDMHNDHCIENEGKDTRSSWSKPAIYNALSLDDLKISDHEREKLKAIIWEHRDCFSVNKFDLGKCNFYKAQIELKRDYVAKWIPSRPLPYKLQDEMDKEIEGLLKAGVIEPSTVNSKWNSQCFLVEKNTPGKFRFVVDMRAVNSQCLPDSYELSNINHVLDKVGRCKFWSTLDFSQSFHQVEYEDSFKPITCFLYHGHQYMFSRMVMGHCNSSSNFSRMMDKLLLNVPIDTLVYFLDDLLLASHTVEEHLHKLEIILKKFRAANLKLSPAKCDLLRNEVNFVGITINDKGVSINKERTKSISQLDPPTNRKELLSVLGVFGYNRKFLPNYASESKILYSLLKKESKNRFSWTDECQAAFDRLKHLITSAPILSLPDIADMLQSYIVSVDASDVGYGVMLTQIIEGERRIIAYYSKSVPPRKHKLSACKLEFLCMHSALLHWKM